MAELPHEIWVVIAEETDGKSVRALRCVKKAFAGCKRIYWIAGSKLGHQEVLEGSAEMLRHYLAFVDIERILGSESNAKAAEILLRILVETRPWQEMKKYLYSACGEIMLMVYCQAGKLTAEDWKEISRDGDFFMERSVVPWADYLDWDYISEHGYFLNSEVEKCKEKINWRLYSRNRFLDTYEIEKWAKYLDWEYLSGQVIILGVNASYYGWVKRNRIRPEYREQFERRLRAHRMNTLKGILIGAVVGLIADIVIIGAWVAWDLWTGAEGGKGKV